MLALLSSIFPFFGNSQVFQTLSVKKFYINGKPTRTGADAAMFPDSPTRLKIDLSGSWRFSLDGKTWGTVEVPSALDFTGKVIFQRALEIKPEMLDKYTFLLVVYGINYQSEITINGNFVGRHTGGYTSVVLPIQNNTLQVGTENSITISVDNELSPRTTVPLRQQVGGWRSYCGIFRDIYILAVPKLFIDDLKTTSSISPDFKSAKISVQGNVTDRWSGLKSELGSLIGFQVEVYDKLSGEIVGRSSITPFTLQRNKTISVNADVLIPNPKLWSPEVPDLYIFKCQLVRSIGKEITLLDEYSIDVGIRNIQWKDGRLFLNNNLLILKGILWQEDHYMFGSAMTYEALERDVASIKTLGANLIRFLYPPHPYMLNLCDRYGIFVLEEIPVTDVPYEIFSKEYYQEMVTAYAKEMVYRDRHHVSVLGWGIGNGIDVPTSFSCEFVNSLRNIIRSLDHRPVFFATRSMNNPCFEYVDIAALNSYGDEPKEYREALKAFATKYPDKPIIVVRYGKEVEPGNHSGYSDPYSMESQARYAMQFYNTLKEMKIAGSILWSYNDWRTDRPSLTTRSHDPYLCAMGIVSHDREKRTAFDVVRALYNDEKVQALPVGNYSSNTPIVYVISGFIMLISFAFMYNAIRRFRDGVNRSLFRAYNFFADVRDQRILTYVHTSFLAIVISVTGATLLSSIFAHYRDNLLIDNLSSQIMTDVLKEWFIYLVWDPLNFILIISGIIFLKLIILSLFIKFLSMLVKTRVLFYHAFSVTIWSSLPYIILIPIAMIVFRLMEIEFYIIPIFILIALISFWVLLRLFKGISIIFDVFPIRVYTIGFLILIIACIAVYGYLDYTKSTVVYLKYLLQTANY
ncbi:MAG: glycoside hydrolase family 2 TIM barrel-domain containing protein [Bacteroidota bacterium]|nr:glycoside hydrolase family 2 TIM barrel-domain containing protein [Bacteroidota bacterium]